MRVLLFSFIENRRSTGMGKWTHEMAAELEARGCKVDLWFADQLPWSRRLGRWSVLTHPFELAVRLRRCRCNFDVMVLHEPCAVWCAAARRCAAVGVPVVAMCHNVESKVSAVMRQASQHGLAETPWGGRVKQALARRWQSDSSIRWADAVVCLSSEDATYIHGTLGVPAAKITQLRNGVRGAPSCEVSRATQRALFVGGWLDIKGRRVLPRLWSEVHKSFPSAALTLAGTGAGFEAVSQGFEPHLRSTLRVLPRIEDDQEMRQLYEQHTLMIMPSLSEGSPLALFEALAGGLPMVASRVGGIPDIIEGSGAGWLFDPLDPQAGAAAVNQAFAQAEELNLRRLRARALGKQFTWAEPAKQLLAVLRTLALPAARRIQ